jgi:hypothetical protein
MTADLDEEVKNLKEYFRKNGIYAASSLEITGEYIKYLGKEMNAYRL